MFAIYRNYFSQVGGCLKECGNKSGKCNWESHLDIQAEIMRRIKDVGTMGKESRWGKLNWIKQRILRLWWMLQAGGRRKVGASQMFRLADCGNKAIHKHGKCRESGHLGEDLNILSSDLNIFILALMRHLCGSCQMVFGWKTESNINFELLRALVYEFIKKLSNRSHAGWTYKQSSGYQWWTWGKQKKYKLTL